MEDAGKAALLAGITKAPRDYLPGPGNARPLRRRNEILALMARNGYIPENLAKRLQAEPEVRLLELAGAYRAMASGILAEPYIIDRVTGASGEVLYEAARTAREFDSRHLNLIQEGLRGWSASREVPPIPSTAPTSRSR
jgi:membrane peptidoglycan carboxypeptidase